MGISDKINNAAADISDKINNAAADISENFKDGLTKK
ncbi:hypothetical protein J3A64_003974 [Pseudarthrobacter sp. PvP004]|nr:hypothetical protein [Pseudarthrobacter sp. PvP004]